MELKQQTANLGQMQKGGLVDCLEEGLITVRRNFLRGGFQLAELGGGGGVEFLRIPINNQDQSLT